MEQRLIRPAGNSPPLSTPAFSGGTMFMNNGANTIYSTVVLGNDATFYRVDINNSANSILRLNGHTLQISEMLRDFGTTANTTGLDAGVSGSTLKFIGTGLQGIRCGNQQFGGVYTAPDVYVSNQSVNNGACINDYSSSASLLYAQPLHIKRSLFWI